MKQVKKLISIEYIVLNFHYLGTQAATNYMDSLFRPGISDLRFTDTEYMKFHSVVGKDENTLIFTLPAQTGGIAIA